MVVVSVKARTESGVKERRSLAIAVRKYNPFITFDSLEGINGLF
jgi:hypothetical protein